MIRGIKKSFEDQWLEKYGSLDIYDHAFYYAQRMLEESVHQGLVKEASLELPKDANPLLTLMHDTAHDLDRLRDMSHKMAAYLKDKKVTDSTLYVIREYIDSAYKSIRDQLDLFYVRSKTTTNEGTKP